MRLASLIAALTLAASPCLAAIGVPVNIGSAAQAAGSTTLTFTTTATCPVSGLVVVAIGTFPSTGTISSVTDGTTSVYGSATGFTGTGIRGALWAPNGGGTRAAVPAGNTITVTTSSAAVAQEVAAICIPGITFSVAPGEAAGTPATATSATPAVTPAATANYGDIEVVLTLIAGGSADSWVESAGYTSLTPVLSTNALRWAYQIVSGTSPGAYSATNGASRTWANNNKPYKPAVCSLSATGAGPC